MKSLWKRALSLLAVAAMTCSSFPTTVFAETQADLLAVFTFDDETNGFVGGKAKATGTYSLEDSFDTNNGKALYLNGTGQFLTVTDKDGNSLLAGKDEITVSYDAKPEGTDNANWVFYAAPDNHQQSSPEYYIGAFIKNGTTKTERYNNGRTVAIETATGTAWSHVDIVFEKNTTTVYVDGVKKQAVNNSNAQLKDILGEDGILQIGKANWTSSGEFYKGWIDNFCIYDGALTEAELVDGEAAEKAVAADKAALTLESEVTGDFTLPSSGEKGSVITWTVSKNENAVIGTDGYKVSITRPEADHVTVTFTATIKMGTTEDTKSFEVVVKREATDEDVVADALKKLEIVNADKVKGNVTLPTTIAVDGTDKVAEVVWSSDNTAVVTDKDADGKTAGVVTRQKKDTSVVMTATVSCGSVSDTKRITLHVVAAPTDLDDDYTAGYMWAHFDAEGGYEKMFFGYSEDGLTWEKLNKDTSETAQPVLTNDAEGSDKGVRDPHIIRSAEGDKYWIIGTDLHAEGGGAGGSGWNQLSASQNIVVWESDDLVSWSEPRLVFAGLDTAGCVWAPEAIYDEEAGDYLVYWAARDYTLAGTNDNALRMYVCRTRDFVSFTEPQVWLNEDPATSDEVNIIDVTVVKGTDGKYYRFATSDWNTIIDVSDTLSTDLFDVRISDGQSVNGDWTRLVKRSESTKAGFDSREGFTVYQLPDGTWCAMGDKSGYKAFLTDDLASAKFTSGSCSFVDGRFRHGTVMRLSQTEQDTLLAAYGEDKDITPTPTPGNSEKKVLAQFDFDDAETGFVSDYAKATGTYSLAESWSDKSGKALSLNGTSTNFLTVTDKDGGSLLTGATELTISFEAKPSNTDTNWPFYAAPSAASPNYNVSEHYLGFLMRNGSLTIERYNQNGSRPSSASAAIGSGDWVRVDVVLTANNTNLYINGRLESEMNSSYKLESILGDSSILQIGKANWGSGEFYNGLIDNITILNYALTADEVAAAAADFVSTLPMVESAVVGTAPTSSEAANNKGTDTHTAITTLVDSKNKVLTPYVRNCAAADVKKLPVTLALNGEVTVTVNGENFVNGSEMDLSNDVTIVAENTLNMKETWTIKAAVLSNNPVLPGQYADPDIDYFDGKYWIFPTTDGSSGWSGTVFHAWSSEDLVNWTDEGIIMDLANDNPGKNEKGIEICASDWAVGSAWAPSIEEKDGKYYFYYCGKFSSGTSAIGVAVADDPAGPYTDLGEALLTVEMVKAAGLSIGQAIDPSIFTDDDGTSYVLFGNGSGKGVIAELGDDMMSIVDGSLKQVNDLVDFRESVVVMKIDGKYHWTWSCDDTGSPNYHVNYGISDTLDGKITFVKTLLSKNEELNILGTAHQSLLHIQDVYGQDRYFIAYHRFYTPLNIYTSGLGYHRETCIDEITFDENGYMVVSPTLEGINEVYVTIDKSKLKEELEIKLDASDYTKESWDAYIKAYEEAENVYVDKDATPQEIAEVLEVLKEAKKNLVAAQPELPYVDVCADDWFYDAVSYAYINELMTGMDPTHFGPYETLSRAQFALILYRIAGEPEVKTEVSAFTDVVGNEWYGRAVIWAAEAGVVGGYEDKTFGPADLITREQMALMMYRYAAYLGNDVTIDGDYSSFADAGMVSGFAAEAMRWAVGKGIITGKSEGTMIDPLGNTARSETAIIIQRFLNK